jgi:hypothetical protein
VCSCLFLLYAIQLFNFINIYFFRNPIYNSEAYNLSSRLLSNYISLAQKHGTKIIVISDSPKNNFKHYLFETNSYNRETALHIRSLYQENKFEFRNAKFTRCENGLALPAGTTVITDAVSECKAVKPSPGKANLIIPLLADSGAIYNIYTDSVCKKYFLRKYPANFSFSDFSVENLSEKRFCEKFIVNPRARE